jgi:nitroimidazol reductase NimA-like FMN-containing flavoprotein (pyridoxamine 5'-phosphate oxidase superfamily)
VNQSGQGTQLPAAIVEAGPRGAADGRGRLEVLTEREVLDALQRTTVGRIAFVVDGWPVVVPINFVLDGRDVVFRTDPGGKLTACQGGRVCFQADRSDCVYERGWSALAFGIADQVHDRAEIDRLQQMELRPWAGGAKAHWVRVRVAQWSGRRLPRAWRYPMPTR